MRLNYLAFQYVDLSVPGEGCCRTRKAPAMFDENVFCNLEIYNLRFFSAGLLFYGTYHVVNLIKQCTISITVVKIRLNIKYHIL